MHHPPFTALAAVYDAIMADVEYDHWADFVLTYAREGNLSPQTALDLACGTGNFTRQLCNEGLEVTATDLSEEMLEVARQRFEAEDLRVQWQRADVRSFRLGRRFDLITCVFDSLNNLLEPEELQAAFLCVKQHLKVGGLWACDLNTRLGVRELWENDMVEGLVTTEQGQEVHYNWVHQHDETRDVGTVQAFCKVLQEDGSWQEFTETHHERGYDPADLEPLLTAAGFERWEIVEYPDYASPTEQSPRVWVFAWNTDDNTDNVDDVADDVAQKNADQGANNA